MELPTLTQIVPALHPQADSVGDYALNLAIQLRDRYGIQSRFIVCDPQWDGPSRVEGCIVRRLRMRNEAGIWCLLAAAKESNAAVLLHYSGHGYHRLGTPFWLYRGIKSWLMEFSRGAAAGQKQFSTVFHELWALPSKPWKRGFYLSLFQRRLIARLHRRSKISITNTLRMQKLLDGIQPRKTWWVPIPSNAPPVERPEIRNRCKGPFRIAIFGQPGSRCATVKAHTNLLHNLDRKKQLTSVMLMGRALSARDRATPEAALLQQSVSHAPIQILGELSPKEVSLSLGRADLYLTHCRGEYACKSGALMAALAAGCPAILQDGDNAAPLNESEHFLASDDSPQSVKKLERAVAEGRLGHIGTAGRSWYDRYADWKVVAPQYQAALFQDPLRPEPISNAIDSTTDHLDAWRSLACPSTD